MPEYHVGGPLAALVAVVLVAAPLPVAAQVAPPAATQAAQDALRLALSVERPRVVPGEPVYASVRLTNTGERPVEIRPDLGLEAHAVTLHVTPPAGSSFVFMPLAVDDADVPLAPLAPGAALFETFPIFYGGRGWTFRAPGIYRLTARYEAEGTGIVVRSPQAELHVGEADPASGLFLAEGPDGRETGRFLVWQAGDHLRRGIAVLREAIARYPGSPLAHHARLALAESRSRAFHDYSIGRVRPPDYEAALALFEQVDSSILPTYLRVGKSTSEARGLVNLGRTGDAASRLRDAERLARDRPDFERLLRVGEELEPRLRTLR